MLIVADGSAGPPVGRSRSLAESFNSQVRGQPASSALIWRGADVSYAELGEMVSRAAARLGDLGLAEHEPVGILAAKSPSAIALILGCLLTGRRFLLPPPTLAAQSLKDLFQRAGCRHVLSTEAGTTLHVTSVPAEAARPALCPDGIAGVSFMLTTSGSTGMPKIVPLSADAVDRFTDWAAERFRIRPGLTVFNYAPLNFDLCLLDVWATLKHGGRVVLVESSQATDARRLLDLIERHDVRIIQAVPMLYSLLTEEARRQQRRLGAVEHVIFTGDSMPAPDLAALPHLFGGARLYNVYGCTETNDSFLYELDPAAPPPYPVPLGEPLPGVTALIVDARGAVVTGPGLGELYVSTPFQAAGYLESGLSAEAFVPHPEGRDRRPYFRTGDLVSRHPDGRLTLEGRNDFQVKVRGIQVNTQAVEQVLLEHKDVTEAAVVAVRDPVAGRVLLSVVRRRQASRVTSLALRAHCAQRLPPAAVPTTMQVTEAPLPKTPTGKVDRTAVARGHRGTRTRAKDS